MTVLAEKTRVKIRRKFILILSVILALSVFTGCEEQHSAATLQQEPRSPVLPGQLPVPSTGEVYLYQRGVTIDTSNTSEGYVMVRYSGTANRVVAQVSMEQTTYTFNLSMGGAWDVFPLTLGDGAYTISVFEHVYGQMFALLATKDIRVRLRHHTLPFLHPNQYVNFNSRSNAVALAAALAEGAYSELDVVANIYDHIINNIEYDHKLALAIVEGRVTTHLPNIDATLRSGRGICFDYAALMAAMLRAQKIPTKLAIGYISGGIYHAWISVYTQEMGWVNVVRFDGLSWTLMDPTFSAGAAQGAAVDLSELIGDGANHQPMFFH